MKSYEKLKAKIKIYEELIDELSTYLREMKEDVSTFLPPEIHLPSAGMHKVVTKEITNFLLHCIWVKEEQIWKLK